jgi:hypothetical protein
MTTDAALLDWMLDSDPALRWQVQRDLAGSPEWEETRSRVATEGCGARLLALQDPDGQWDGGSYFPAGFTGDEDGQPWTATTWSLNALRGWGVAASALSDTADRLQRNSRWEYNNEPYWNGEVDVCINAYTLANGAWLGADVSGVAQWFRDHQLADGGWNCEWENGSTVASFHSTINALKGIRYYETHADATIAGLREPGEEYLLQRRLLFGLRSSEYVAPWVSRFAYPFRWRYSALNALDYFRSIDRPDPRLEEAVELVRSQRQADGSWIQAEREPGRTWFDVDVPAGEPSRWLTFYATRVLDWWDGSAPRA